MSWAQYARNGWVSIVRYIQKFRKEFDFGAAMMDPSTNCSVTAINVVINIQLCHQ